MKQGQLPEILNRNDLHIWQRGVIPHSGAIHESGHTLSWFHSDDLATYQKQGNRQYSETDITYVFNRLGYRSKEFDEIDHDAFKLLVIGCSMTMGIGLPIVMTFGEKLAALIREQHGIAVEVINLAMGGTSIDYTIRVLFQSVPVLRPNYVFCLLPESMRREYVTYKDRIYGAPYGHWMTDEIGDAMTLLANETSDLFAFVKNMALLEFILQHHQWSWDTWGTFRSIYESVEPTIWSRYFDTTRFRHHTIQAFKHSKARDGMHNGEPYHTYVANDLLTDAALQTAITDYKQSVRNSDSSGNVA